MLKKVIKWTLRSILWIVAVFIAIDLLIVTLITIPPIQQYIILKASKILTNLTGGEITVDKIYLSPNLTLTAENIAIKDHHHENMIFASSLKGRINLAKTAKGQVCLTFAQLDDGDVVFRKYKNEEKVNIAIWAQGFKKEDKKDPNFKLLFENIKLNNVRFVIINDDKRLFQEDNTIDYAFFEFQNINLNVDNFLVFGPDISCNINSLSLSQYTGFEITSFKGDFRIHPQGLIIDSLHFTTPNSLFNGDFAFSYNDFPDFSDFVNLINFDTKVKSACIAMRDVSYFAPKLNGMDNQFIFSGYVGGAINQLKTKDLYLKYKQQTYIAGNFDIDNILDFKKSSFILNLKDVNINFNELAQLKLPNGKRINLPETLNQLSYSRIRGIYCGSLTKFNTNLAVQTNLGKVDIEIKATPQNNIISYSGTIDCKNIEIGKLLSQSKYVNSVNLKSSIEGEVTNGNNFKELISSASVKIRGRLTEMDIFGYPLDDVMLRGNYKDKKAELALKVSDSLALFSLYSSIDLAKEIPKIDATLSKVSIKLHEIFSHFTHDIDSSTVTGFEKIIYKVKRTPNLVFSVDTITIDMSGNQLDNLNGFLRIDYAKLTDGKRVSRIDWLRLNAINKPNSLHQYLVHTNLVNISLKTNYNHKDGIAAIAGAAQYYIPDLFAFESLSNNKISSSNTNHYFDLNIQFFYSRNFFDLIMPEINIARNASVSVFLGEHRSEDIFKVSFPQVSYTGLGRLVNFSINGKNNENQAFNLQVQSDSLILYQKGNNLSFTNIDINTKINKKEIEFQTSWYNPKSFSIYQLNQLSVLLFQDSLHINTLKITDSKIYLRESMWQFIEDRNIINFGKQFYKFDNCILSSDIGKISVNGEISKQSNEKCSLLLENFDISLLNSFTSRMSMSFGGNMSLVANIHPNIDYFTIEGNTFVKNFVFNEELLGDLFLEAKISEDGNPHFSGGVLSISDNININLSEFNYSKYSGFLNKMTDIKGVFFTNKKELRVHADIDTLKIGFLSPFLASFSNDVSGEASGNLDFFMNPDSLYFDGKIKIINAKLGIEPLNTVYYINNQEILFNRKGIDFNNIILKDKFDNNASLSGFVNHSKFKDFIIDLKISTPKLLALNTPKKVDSPFYGDGYVSGDISIQGDTKTLNFSSHNIKTLPGSTITFPLSSASTVSSSKGIYFVQSVKNKDISNEIITQKPTTFMNFDFLFDITRDADVKLELDPIDGILKCKTSGKLHLTYSSNSGMIELDGILSIVTGKFNMSLKNLFPRDFTIVEGGTISFLGPLTAAQLNVSALYQKAASLNSLSPTLNIGRTDVSAYLNLKGSLMNPDPSFTFDFPRLTNEEQFRVFAALDTADQQNGIRQFFSFVFLNTFITAESNMNDPKQYLGTGLDFVSGILTSFISNNLNNVSIGVNINNQENYQEYSVNAAVRFNKDRGLIKTNLGYAANAEISQKGNNNLVADLSFEYDLNKEGNWKFRAFYFNDVASTDASKPQQGGGVGIIFQQEFNNRKDFSENWAPKKKGEKAQKYYIKKTKIKKNKQ